MPLLETFGEKSVPDARLNGVTRYWGTKSKQIQQNTDTYLCSVHTNSALWCQLMPFVQREPFCKVQHQMANLQPEAERQVLLGQQEPKLHRDRTENYSEKKNMIQSNLM